MDRKEGAAVFHCAFEAFGFILGYTHADKSANYAANRAARTKTGKRTHDRTRSDQRTYSGNG